MIAGNPRRSLVENDMPLGHDVLRFQVRGDLVRVDLDVLVFDEDVLLENRVLIADVLVFSAFREMRNLDVAALIFLQPGRDFELRLRLVVVLPGRPHVLRGLREEQRGSSGEEKRGSGAEERG